MTVIPEPSADPPAVTEEKPAELETDLATDAPTLALRSGFAGSSKHGGGNTGLAGAFPLPEGPPPPTLRLDPDCC